MTTYTPAQRAAIECVDRPLQIIACAGSGKTQVISQRIADILALPGVEPANVVAFTFTEKAAAELKDRVLSIVGERSGDTTGLAEMSIGTMHAYCLTMLQTFVPETFKFGVLTEITQRLFIDRNSQKSGLATCPTMSSGTPFLRRYVNSRLYAQVLSVLKEDDVDLDAIDPRVLASSQAYTWLAGQHAYFDYSTMLSLAVEYLEVDEGGDLDVAERAVLEHLRSVKYAVVDEYQDANPLQERLIRALVRFGANLCVVGDDDQTIYQWRGSEVANIITFADRYDGVERVTLADNFRSSPGVIALGRTVAEWIPAGNRLPKRMEPGSHQTWERGDLLALTFDSSQDEARWMCDRLEELRGVAFVDTPTAGPRGLSWSDMAVLFRSVARDAGPLVEELDARAIPYVVKGLTRLFESPEIAAVVGLFRYMVDEIDGAALATLWADARLLPIGGSIARALRVLDEGRDFSRGQQWGVYNIQRLYLDVLETLEIREDTIPGDATRAELVLYQLGKFSQVISDFEEINFSSSPEQKYRAFAAFLRFQAPDYYADADADVGYATPDAVTISTVHQAKGMQWPAVFVPALRRNRFPAKRQGGLGLFHVVPEAAVHDADRYRGTVDDERRLFYVATTRSQKYVYLTFSPGESSLYKKPSEFFVDSTAVPYISTADDGVGVGVVRLEPRPRHETPQVTLSFSELKYLFECPYQFKLRFMYGFNPPIHEALGYGKGLHDALAEMHKRALAGDVLDSGAVDELVDRHLHTPYAYPALREQLRRAARGALERYFAEHGADLPRTIHSEKQIQVHIAPGITVDGRIDLVKRLETDEVSIVDFKSTDRAQAEDVTRDQLHVYAVGYRELTGEQADLIEVLNLDAAGKNTREVIREPLLVGVRDRIRDAGQALRDNELPRHPTWCAACNTCDLAGICRSRPSA